MQAMAFQRPPDQPPREPPILSGRVPPNDLEAEAAVLAACLLDVSRLTIVRAVLVDGSDSFYSDNHRLIFDAMCDLQNRGEVIDAVTVKHWLADRELIQRAGGAKYIGALVDETPAVGNVETHARIVAEMRRRRALIAKCQFIQAAGYGEVSEAWVAESVADITTLGTTASSADVVLDAPAIFAELPPIPWICEDLEIAPGPPTMFAGYGYSKKTLSTQSLAMSVASGSHAFGRWPVRQGKVVHVDYEQGARLTCERYQRLGRGLELDEASMAGQLELISLPRTYLDSPNAESVYCRWFDGATMAVVDSLRAAAPSVDENSSEARIPLDMLARVSERTGCTIIVIHHARKPQVQSSGGVKMNIRGSGALFDACQCIFVLGSEEGDETARATHEKARITGNKQAPFAIRATDSADRSELVMTAEDAEELEEKQANRQIDALASRILTTVRKHPGMGTKAIAKLAHKRPGAVATALEILEADGAVKNLNEGTRGGARWHAHAKGNDE